MRCFDLGEGEAGKRVASIHPLADLDRWLSSPASRRSVHELHALLTGADLSGSLLYEVRERPENIKRRLAEAFRSGELAALPIGPIRFEKAGGGGGVAPANVSRPAPVVVPLLADKPEKKAAPGKDKKEEQAWVAIELIDEEGKPVAGARYRLVLPDGSVREGQLDAKGTAHVEGIAPGQCKVSFPDLDPDAWSTV